MGMYTELIIGCLLRKDTPKEVISTLEWMFRDNENEPEPDNLPGKGTRVRWMFRSAGSYFGSPSGERKLIYDEICEAYRLSGRFNIKNYEHEIETFLDWLEPFVDQGSGAKEIWAMHIYEEDDEYSFRKLKA